MAPGLWVLGAVLLGWLSSGVAAPDITARVVHVAAGDRLKVRTATGTVAVRLAHVRAPRRDHFYWGRARRALGELVLDRQVTVRPVGRGGGVLEARVLAAGVDVAALLVGQGMLMAGEGAPPPFGELEAAARRHRRGIWGSGVAPAIRP